MFRRVDDWQRNLIEDDEERLLGLLREARRVAVLGIKTEVARGQPAYYVPQALQQMGLEIVPVPVYYPEAIEILGQKVYRKVVDVPGEIDIVDVFRGGPRARRNPRRAGPLPDGRLPRGRSKRAEIARIGAAAAAAQAGFRDFRGPFMGLEAGAVRLEDVGAGGVCGPGCAIVAGRGGARVAQGLQRRRRHRAGDRDRQTGAGDGGLHRFERLFGAGRRFEPDCVGALQLIDLTREVGKPGPERTRDVARPALARKRRAGSNR